MNWLKVVLRVNRQSSAPAGERAGRELARLGRQLRRYGVPARTVEVVLNDLRADLEEAEANGLGTQTVLGQDIRRLAAGIARAHGRAPAPRRFALVVVAMAVPLLAVAFATYVGIGGGENLGLSYYTVSLATHETVPTVDGTRTNVVETGDEWLPLVVYALAGVAGVAGAFGSAAAALGVVRDCRTAATLKRLMATVPAGGVLGISAAIALGNATHYSTKPEVIAAETAVAGAFVVLAIVLAREWALRLPREEHAPERLLAGLAASR